MHIIQRETTLPFLFASFCDDWQSNTKDIVTLKVFLFRIDVCLKEYHCQMKLTGSYENAPLLKRRKNNVAIYLKIHLANFLN